MEPNECPTGTTPTPPEPFTKLWCLIYRVKGEHTYSGMAVVSAQDAQQAERTFKADCVHNGYQDRIRVESITQIPFPVGPKPTLIAENYVKVFE